jgi:predicted 2-oxoglutarate/Fe(II)-dependent dioxygenase YbiX
MIKPDEIVGGCVAIFKNAFLDSELIIESIEKETDLLSDQELWQWKRSGTISDGTNQEVRTNFSMHITKNAKLGNKAAKDIHNVVFNKIEKAVEWYAHNYQIPVKLYHEPYTILKYSYQQEYKAHYDGTTQTARAVSVVIYLNDDYEGGEIEFPNFDIKIKPKAGTMILFPSNFAYTHIAHPVNNGIKYAIVTWLHDWLSPEVPQLPIKKSLLNIGIIGEIK